MRGRHRAGGGPDSLAPTSTISAATKSRRPPAALAGNRALTPSAPAHVWEGKPHALVWTPLTGNRYRNRWGPARFFGQFRVTGRRFAAGHSNPVRALPPRSRPRHVRKDRAAARRYDAVRRADLDLGPVPERGFRRQARDDRASGGVGGGVGDRGRQGPALFAHPP